MPLSFVRQDITRLACDAIVNAANTELMPGGGVCGAIFDAAGFEDMRQACREIGHVDTGSAVATPGFRLPARYVIHTAGPVWHGGSAGERASLTRCYRSSLELAVSLGCRSIAFPLISAGIYGYPRAEAFEVAVDAIRSFLVEDPDLEVTLCLFDRQATTLAEDVYGALERCIDDGYVDSSPFMRYRFEDGCSRLLTDEEVALAASAYQEPSTDASYGMPAPSAPSPTIGSSVGSAGVPASSRPEAIAPPQADAGHAPSEPLPAPSLPLPAPAAPAPENAGRTSRREGVRKRLGDLFSRSRREASAPPAMAADSVAVDAEAASLEELLVNLDASFADTLLAMIDERGLSDAEVYGRANLSRQYFSKLRSGRVNPSKRVVCALAVALGLDLDETRLLLERAGHALTHASRFDIIVEWFIMQGSYDVYEINQALFRFDQPLLGTS